jgi:hypothetical protein
MDNIRVPNNWAMYTSAGNRALKAKAETVARKIEKLTASGDVTPANVSQVLTTYLVSWLRSEKSKGMSEAGDTAVRECVGDFHDRVWNHVFGSNGERMWDAHLAAAYRRHSN